MKNEKILSENITIINKIKNRCLKNGLELTDENFDYIETIGLIATCPNIAKQLISKKRIDKEELIFYNIENYMNSRFHWGYLYEGDYYLMAHQYFRRDYYKSNNYGPNFIWEFWDCGF